MPYEVACVDLTPFDHARAASILRSADSSLSTASVGEAAAATDVPQLAAVGMWMGHGLALLTLPDLEVVHREPLPETTASTGTAVLPRSILMAQMDDMAYLFAAMADGTLYFYTIDPTPGSWCVCVGG